MTHISLIFPSSPFLINQQVFPPLGILYLSAWLKDKGWKVQCLDMSMGHTEDNVKADIVGISITTAQRQEGFRVAKILKKKGKILIAGGPHATYMPQECLDNGFDYVVQGEGEEVLNKLLGDLVVGSSIRDRVLKSEGKPLDVNKIPLPDRKALDIHAYNYWIDGTPATTIMTSRGCPYNCSFCARVTKGCRIQSADRTVEEIVHLSANYHFFAFMIFDDIFTINKSRTREIVERLEGKGYSFRCFSRANLIDEENCELMKRMGVVEVGIGVESGSDEILSKNIKGTTRSLNSQAFRLLKKYGIRAKAFIIVGLPGESIATISDTISWIKETEPYDIDVSIFQPLPGSPIFDNPEDWGIKFNYNGNPSWYKGIPGEYESSVSTASLSSRQIVEWRDYIEARYKRKELLR